MLDEPRDHFRCQRTAFVSLSHAPTVLLAGDFLFSNYEQTFARALRACGAEVAELPLAPFFGPFNALSRAQRKYLVGPGRWAANLAFVAACRRHEPDLALVWRSPYLYPWAIAAARRAGAKKIVLYNNDNPFGPDRDAIIWREFRRLIPLVDGCVAVRSSNLADYQMAGCRDVFLMQFYYDPSLHRPQILTDAERAAYDTDAIFIGHCEPDRRLDWMDELLETNLRVRIFGSGWEQHAKARRWERLLPIRPLWGDEYVKAIAGAKTGVVFLSSRNRDAYTIRNFEIPAIGTLMVSQRTNELLDMFRDGEEALFFSDGRELVSQVRRAVQDEAFRLRVANAGHRRCVQDGHDSVSRARALLRHFC